MKHTIRAFAFGLCTATALLAFTYYETQEGSASSTPTEEDARQVLKQEGYHILSTKDYKELEEAAKQAQKKQDDNQETNSEKSESGNKKNIFYSLTIDKGISSSEISKKLMETNIIEDEEAFNQYLQMNDYSRFIQVGTYEVHNNMSYKQIAKTITNK
ncbi:endolytic transglycosylase MltG [Pontibacillus salicampi]|uniref:Endolytic transglycosylase MltG n=1 Tax=Pontibacillus salicampi TaxID=1449801 RepID=A0ABV6LJS0_9BACI